MKHVPNVLTIGRILITPPLLLLLLSESLVGHTVGTVLFILAAISDYVDGKIARTYAVKSRLGQFLDPFADKVLVLGTFVVLIFTLPQVVSWWGVALVALRDLGVTLMRSWAEAHGRSLRTLQMARAKTAVQLTFLISTLLFMIAARVPGPVAGLARAFLEGWPALVFFWAVVAFTVLTGVLYLVRQEYTSPIKLNG